VLVSSLSNKGERIKVLGNPEVNKAISKWPDDDVRLNDTVAGTWTLIMAMIAESWKQTKRWLELERKTSWESLRYATRTEQRW
jgi:hypothetical protein